MNLATTSKDIHKTTLRFSGDDWQQILPKIEASGLSTNAYFRQLAMKNPKPKQAQISLEQTVEDGEDKRLCVRVRPVEQAIVQHHAQTMGLSQSAYVRQLILDAPLPRKSAVRVPKAHSKVLGQWLGELGRLGNNINQIARNLNIAAKSGDMSLEDSNQEILGTVQAVEALLVESAKDILHELNPVEAA